MEFIKNTKITNSLHRNLLCLLATALVYFFTARLGLHLATINHSASPVWPATGVALFSILLGGPWMAIGVFMGAFAANYLTGTPLTVVTAIACGNTLEALAGIWIFRILIKSTDRLGPHAKLINYVGIATAASAISASFGSFALYFANLLNNSELRDTWLTWWVGDTLGALILFPLAVLIWRKEFTLRGIPTEKLPKLFLTLALPIGLSALVFGTSVGPPFLFVIFLSLLFTAVWLPSSWIYLNSLVICALCIWYTKSGLGPFTGGVLNENLMHLQLFLAGVGLTAIMLASLRKEGILKSPSLALLFGWFLTGMAFYSFYHSSTQNDEEYFAHQTDEATHALRDRLSDYARLLESGTALFAASEDVNREEWHSFINHLRFDIYYPGIEGIGVIVPAKDQNQIDKLIAYQKSNGFPDFKIKNVAAAPEYAVSEPPLHLIVKYVEPMATNGKIIGLDASLERRRLEGALRARDTGLPTITEQILLVQADSKKGFIVFAPFYKKGASLNTIEERQKAFKGLVYAPVVVENFVHSALKPFRNQFDLKMFFGSEVNPKNEVYSSPSDNNGWSKSKSARINLAGMPVTLLWKRGPEFKTESSVVASWAGFCGALISIFLAVLLSGLENLTDRAQKIAEKKNYELSQRERLWRALSESSPVGIFLCDDQGEVTYINPTFSKLLGSGLPEILKAGWQEYIHPDDRERTMQSWNQYKFAPAGNYNCSFRFMTGTKILHVTSASVPLRNEFGVITGYVGTIQDLTELHLKQMALVASSRMSSLGEMAGGVAHEINNPLAIISGKAQQLSMLLEKPALDTEKANTHIEAIKSNVERIAKIIKGLRTIARDVPDDPIREVRAKDILQDTLELCRSRFKHHEIALIVPNLDSEEAKCFARPEQIVQVLLNLLNNAFDAVSMLDEKWVKLGVEIIDDKLQFSVTDSGKTLNHEIQEKIFVPFYTTKEVGKGTGLGLSISRSIIEKHHGRLYIDEKEQNTKFVVELKTKNELDFSNVV